jgi:hypothetical protein
MRQPVEGDRMIVLSSERLGTVVRVDPPAFGETDPVVLLKRDDLPASFPPVPYDLHELAICTLSAAA